MKRINKTVLITHVFFNSRPPIRQSTIMDLNYFSENQSVNIPIEKSDTIYTEEDERSVKLLLYG